MNARTNIQIINGPDGKPAFVVIPYQEYVIRQGIGRDFIPHDVVSRVVDGATPVRAWREYLGKSQEEVATDLGIRQSAYSQQENSKRLRKNSRDRIASVLGIDSEQLNF